MTSVVTLQRIESVVIAALVVCAFVALGYAWWWLPVLFLAFDLSAVGYLHGPRLGALLYNLGHSYTLPVLLAGIAIAVTTAGYRVVPLAVIAGAWVFHIALDRALGYGLKNPTAFNDTHLGRIGKADRKP